MQPCNHFRVVLCCTLHRCTSLQPHSVWLREHSFTKFKDVKKKNCKKLWKKKKKRLEDRKVAEEESSLLAASRWAASIYTDIHQQQHPPTSTHTHIHSLPVGLPCRKCWWRDPRGQWGREGGGSLLLEFGSASCVGRWRGSRVFRQRSNRLQTVRITVLSHAEGARTLARPRAHALNRCCRCLVWTGNIW